MNIPQQNAQECGRCGMFLYDGSGSPSLHIIMSPSVNTYSVEKRNAATLIRSKNGTQLSFSQNMLSGRSCHYVFSQTCLPATL